MSNNDSNLKLFSSVKYYTTGFRDPSVETRFKQNGATRLFYLTEKTTHVICDDFSTYKSELEQAIEIYQTPIVTSDWVISCLKSNSLVSTNDFQSSEEKSVDTIEKSTLFASCTFANANLTSDDHQKAYAMVTYYGGRWIATLDSLLCTHIICASVPRKKKPGEKIESNADLDERLEDAYFIQSDRLHLVTPDWITDCIKADALLDARDYHPDLLQTSVYFTDTEDDTDDENNIIETSRPNDDRFSAKDNFQRKSFSSKRTTTNNAVKTNSSVTSTASTNKDSLTSKLSFEEKLIRPSVSANLGDYRSHLQLSRHAAPETLSYELNYCIQDKHDRIPSSQCLLGCVIYIDEKEYTATVAQEDLSSWSETLKKHGAILTDDPNLMTLTHFVCAYRTSETFRRVSKRGNVRMVTAHWLNDVLQRKKLFVPNLAIHYPTLYVPTEPDKLPLNKYFMAMTGFDGLERARIRYMIRSLGGKYSGHLCRYHTHLIARESGTSEKYIKALDWSIPIVNGLWLSEIFLGNVDALKEPIDDRYRRLTGNPPIDHFSFDQSFVHDLLLPWSQPIRVTEDMLNKAMHSHMIDEDQSSMDVEFGKASRIHESTTNDNSTIKTHKGPLLIMLSGFNAKTLNYYEGIIRSLGGKISTLPQYTTHLIMNKFLRTEKLYECMGHVSYVLNKRWLDKCNDLHKFLPVEESDWLLDEELKPSRNLLKQAIDKRLMRKNRSLFTGYTFYLTPSVQPSQITLKSIIFSAGGNVRRQFPTIKQLTTFDEHTKIPQCLILTCDTDKPLLKDLHKHNNTDFEIKILSIDFVLESIIQQEVLKIESFTVKT